MRLILLPYTRNDKSVKEMAVNVDTIAFIHPSGIWKGDGQKLEDRGCVIVFLAGTVAEVDGTLEEVMERIERG